VAIWRSGVGAFDTHPRGRSVPLAKNPANVVALPRLFRDWRSRVGIGRREEAECDRCLRDGEWVISIDADGLRRWAGPSVTTQAACEASWGSAIFYKRVSGSWVDQSVVLRDYGTWYPAAPPLAPRLRDAVYGFTPQSGSDWRLAGTMRTAYGDSTLRSIYFQTAQDF
jgi:hypothetical protein